MNDKVDKLAQLGTFQLVIGVAVLFAGFTIIKTETVLDEHVQARGAAVEKALEQQTALLRDIQNELRRLQDQRRTVDELKDALRGAAPQVVYAQPAYGPPAPQQQAQPQQAQPQAQQPQAQQPERGPETARVGEGTQIKGDMGTDKDRIPGPDPKAVVGGHVVYATSEPSKLNYYTTSEGTTRQIMTYIIEPMFSVSEQDATKLTPRLATAWSLSEDGLTATYQLRRDAKWSDGAPFTADDVVFTFNVIRDPAVKAEAHRGSYVDVEKLEKVDDYTVKATFKRRYWKGIYVLGSSMLIIPRHWYQKRVAEVAKEKGIEKFSVNPGEDGFGAVFNGLREPCVGTGPYVCPPGGWEAGTSITLDRNPDYWRLRVEPGVWNLQTVKYRFISDHLAIMNQVRQQKVDVQVVDTDEWLDSLSKEKVITDNYKYYNYDHIGLAFNYIAWNCRKFPFDDARARVAMTHLIDRAGMLRDLWRNNGTVATCPNKQIYPEYNKELVPHAFDPAKAAALLKEAGFEDRDKDGVLDKQVGGELKPFSFELKVPSGRAEFERIGNRIKEAMEKVGVRCEIRPIEWSVFIEHLYNRDFDAVCLFASFVDPWVDNFDDYHSSEDIPRGGNTPGWHKPEIDKLLEEMRQELDRTKRIPMYHRLYAILHDEQPMTLLIHGLVDVLAHKRFQNVVVRHAGMKQTYWWVDPSWKPGSN
jgi:peptide/nickel transport system substrate-binding protein